MGGRERKEREGRKGIVSPSPALPPVSKCYKTPMKTTPVNTDFLTRDAMHKRGLCHRAVSVCPAAW